MHIILFPAGKNLRAKGAIHLSELWADGKPFEDADGILFNKDMLSKEARVILLSRDGQSRVVIPVNKIGQMEN